MYFKAKKDTVAFEKITGFLNAIHEQRKQNTKDLEDYIGIPIAQHFRQKNIFSLCGKITSIKPGTAAKRGRFSAALIAINLERDWVPCEESKKQGHDGFFRPNLRRKTGKEISEFIRCQKDYSFGDDNKLYNMKVPELKFSHFGYIQLKDMILINTQDDLIKFTPLEGMIEITITEYNKLKGKK